MKTHAKYFWTFLLSLIVHTSLFGQDNCDDAIYNANNLYNEGKINQAIEMLEPCLDRIRNEDNLFEAYRLLAIAYHDINENTKRDDYIRLMLKSNPYYQDQPNNDPTEFSRAINSFHVSPLVHGRIGAGVSFNSVNFIKSYSPFDYPQKYKTTRGWQFGIGGEYMLTPDIGLAANIFYIGTSIEHETTLEGTWQQDYSEGLQFVCPSIQIRKHVYLKDHLSVNGGLNAGMAIMTSSRVYIVSDYSGKGVEQNTKDGLSERNTLQPNFGIIAGATYHLERSSFELQFGYQWFTRTTVDGTKRFDDTDFIFISQYINDDVKMRLLSVNLTYSIPLIYDIHK